jgi:hypothetical protein
MRNTTYRGEGRLPPGPEQQPFLLGLGDAARSCSAGLRDRFDPLHQVIHLGPRPVRFDNEKGFRIKRITGVNEFLDGVDCRPVHHLHACWDDPGRDDTAHAFAGTFGRWKTDEHGACALRLWQNAHGNLGEGAEEPLRSSHDPEQIVAAGIEMLAAEAYDLAVDQHQLAAEHVIRSGPIFEAVHAA